MNRFIPSATGTVLFRMSRNAGYYPPERGCFEVRYQKTQRRIFFTLPEAFLFYITLEEAAELWEMTDEPIPIEAKVELFLN